MRGGEGLAVHENGEQKVPARGDVLKNPQVGERVGQIVSVPDLALQIQRSLELRTRPLVILLLNGQVSQVVE